MAEKMLEKGMMSMTLEYRIEDRVPDKTKAERCRAIAQVSIFYCKKFKKVQSAYL